MMNYTTTYRINTALIIDHNDFSQSNSYRKQYEEDLKRKQKEHLDSIQQFYDANWQPCLHDSCPECIGTGLKKDGTICVHYISCPCPKCSPSY